MKIFVWAIVFFSWAGGTDAQVSTTKIGAAGDEYTFIRVKYDNANHFSDDGWGSWSSWSVDFPDADINFLRAVTRLTNIHINAEPAVLTLDDDRIFEHPFLYMLEMGRFGGPDFSEKDILNLREYLLRGGFLFIDDFWGTFEWQTFYQAFSRVFPERPVVELEKDHPIFHSFYDIDGPQMIPSIRNSYYNEPESDVDRAINQAILDDEGRVMVLINWNSDIGDGWEHTYSPEYSTKYANMAYQLGINYLIYAMTH